MAYLRLTVAAYGKDGKCPVENQEEAGFFFFVGGGQPNRKFFLRVHDNRFSGASFRSYHDSAPVVAPPVTGPSVYIVTWAFVANSGRMCLTSPGGLNLVCEGSLVLSALGSSFFTI